MTGKRLGCPTALRRKMDIVLSLPNLMLTYFCHMCDCLKRRHPKIHWFRTSFYLLELYLVGIFPIVKHTHFCLPKNIPFGGLLHEPSVRPKFSMATIDAPSQQLYFWCQDMAKQGPTHFRNPCLVLKKIPPKGIGVDFPYDIHMPHVQHL